MHDSLWPHCYMPMQEFVMGTGLIPADGEFWKMRRRAVAPALHKKYVASMVSMFSDCAEHGQDTLDKVKDTATLIRGNSQYIAEFGVLQESRNYEIGLNIPVMVNVIPLSLP